MNGKQARSAVRDLDTLLGSGTAGALTDRELLARYTSHTDEVAEQAITALVDRHGPMVLRVCRAVLRDSHDAEDAFQATFLVLVRRARSLWVGNSLGPWLHRVAYRVASDVRSAAATRHRHERHAVAALVENSVDPARQELGEVIHDEVNRLPEKLRLVVVLCLMAGLTTEQAAQHLKCPVGTVHSRLARGRQRLRSRLARRGHALEIVGLSSQITVKPASVMVPAGLVRVTVHSATQFAAKGSAAGVVSTVTAKVVQDVMRAMIMSKLKLLSGTTLLLAIVLTGAHGLSQSGQPPVAQGPSPPPLAPQVPGPPPRLKYELRIWKNGEPTGKPIVVEGLQGEPVRIDTPDGPLEIHRAPESNEDLRKRKVREMSAQQANEHRHEANFFKEMLQGIHEYRASHPGDDQKIWFIHGPGYRITPDLDRYLTDSMNYHINQAARLDAIASGQSVSMEAGSPPVPPPHVSREDILREQHRR